MVQVMTQFLSLAEYTLLLIIFYRGDFVRCRNKILAPAGAAVLAFVTAGVASMLFDAGKGAAGKSALAGSIPFSVADNAVILSTGFAVLFAFCFLRCRLPDRVLAFCLCYSLQSFLDVIVLFLLNLTGRKALLEYSQSTNFVLALVATLALLLIVFFQSQRHWRIYIGRLSVICITAASLFFTYVVTVAAKNTPEGGGRLLQLFVLGFIMIAAFSLAIILVDSARRRVSYEQASLNQYVDSYNTYLSALEKRENEYRRYRHDMRHHLEVISGLAEQRDNDKLLDYLSQFRERPELNGLPIFRSGNKIADVIIFEKSLAAYNSGVRLRCHGRLCDPYFTSDYDLCVILANLLENAVEYTKNNGFDSVEVYFVTDENRSIIEVRNEIRDNVNVSQSVRSTSKGDRRTHGHGISNVNAAVARYDGDVTYDREGREFVARVLIAGKT